MKYFIWVKETENHDRELAVIDAKCESDALEEFKNDHPEDVDNIESITEEDNNDDLTELNQEAIASSIQEGNTSGRIDYEDEDGIQVHLTWSLTTNKWKDN